MTLDAAIMLVGVLVALLQFLGFPLPWDNTLYLVFGVIVIGLGIAVRRRMGRQRKSDSENRS